MNEKIVEIENKINDIETKIVALNETIINTKLDEILNIEKTEIINEILTMTEQNSEVEIINNNGTKKIINISACNRLGNTNPCEVQFFDENDHMIDYINIERSINNIEINARKIKIRAKNHNVSYIIERYK